MDDHLSTDKEGPAAELEAHCAGCKKSIDALDRFCRHCGLARGKAEPLHQRPWVVLGMLFFVIGPLALPMLWRSSSFSRTQKVAISVANLVFVMGLTLGMVLLFHSYMKMLSGIATG